MTHAPRALFIKYHENNRRIGDSTRMDNACDEKFLNNFLDFIILGKGMMIGMSIGRKNTMDEGNGMIMNTTGRRKSLGSGNNSLMFREVGLEFRMHRGCLNGLNRMELCNNVRMTFIEEIFHVMGTNDIRGTYCDSLALILLALLVELHG
jgi:hypothetical protein